MAKDTTLGGRGNWSSVAIVRTIRFDRHKHAYYYYNYYYMR